MSALRHLIVAVAVAGLVLAGCSDDGGTDDEARPDETTDPSMPTTPTFVGDGSAFCNAMLGVGQIERTADATAEEVLAQNEQLLGLLDEAQTNSPEDAPPDFDSLLDDYRVAAQAIAAAEGDLEAAFAALDRDAPEVVGRLGSSTSHAEAFEFLVDRCGIEAP